MVLPAMRSIVRKHAGACHRAALCADPLGASHHEELGPNATWPNRTHATAANSRVRVPWGRLKARPPAILPQRRGGIKSPSNDEEKHTDSRHRNGLAVTLS